MLDSIRRGISGLLFKILMALLAASFVLWGIAGTFSGFGQGTLARVGNTEIDVDEFRRGLSSVLDNVAQLTRRRPTMEEVRTRQIDRRVLEDMISMTAIDNHARELGLALSAETVSQLIHKDANFTGPDGKFNVAQLRGYLNQNGLSERAYLIMRQKEEVREQLNSALFETVAVPKALIDLVHRFSNERRKIEYFTIDPAKVAKPGDPDEAQLKSVYDSNPGRFMAPQYRSGSILLLTREGVRRDIKVDPARVAAEYERLKPRYEVSEQRRIQQIAFPDKAAAEAAAKAIAGGKNFLDVAKERGAKDSDVDLGLLTKGDLIDPAIANAAFSLDKDKVSAPIEGRYSVVLLRVTELNPGRLKPLDEVKGEIEERLALEEATNRLAKLHDEVDEDRLEGKSSAQVMEKRKGLELITFEAVDRSGKSPEGKTVIENADAALILQSLFERRPGTDAEAIHISNGGYAWIDLGKVTAERQKALDEVKDEVARIWREQEVQNALSELATKLVERGTKGESMAALAKEAGGKLETSPAFDRNGQGATLTPSIVTRTFTVPVGAVVSAAAADSQRAVLKVTAIEPAAPLTEQDSERIVNVVRDGLRNDYFAAYVSELRKRYPIMINEAVLKRAAGAVDQ